MRPMHQLRIDIEKQTAEKLKIYKECEGKETLSQIVQEALELYLNTYEASHPHMKKVFDRRNLR